MQKNACIVKCETFRDLKQTVYSISIVHYPETRQSSPCRKRIPTIQTFALNYNSKFVTILNAVIINTYNQDPLSSFVGETYSSTCMISKFTTLAQIQRSVPKQPATCQQDRCYVNVKCS